MIQSEAIQNFASINFRFRFSLQREDGMILKTEDTDVTLNREKQ